MTPQLIFTYSLINIFFLWFCLDFKSLDATRQLSVFFRRATLAISRLQLLAGATFVPYKYKGHLTLDGKENKHIY